MQEKNDDPELIPLLVNTGSGNDTGPLGVTWTHVGRGFVLSYDITEAYNTYWNFTFIWNKHVRALATSCLMRCDHNEWRWLALIG